MTRLAGLVFADPRRWPVLLAGGAWLMLLGAEHGLLLPALCGAWEMDAWVASSAPLQLLLLLNPPGALLTGWTLMLVAMMLPLIVPQLDHLTDRSGPGRWQGRAAFVLGYVGVWLIGCLLLAMIALVGRIALPISDGAIAAGVALLALVWQELPIKARALKRCHQRPPLRWRGAALAIDGGRFGVRTGAWCFMSCWPWMLVCMVGPGGMATMVPITLLLWHERFIGQTPLSAREAVCRWLRGMRCRSQRTAAR